jgi:hypothetical protein
MDLMIDIESLDTSPECVILTIGVVLFDPKGNGIVDKLELRPEIDEQTEKFNRTISDDTIKWWGSQSPQALDEAMGDRGRESFRSCMEKMSRFCWNRRAVWSNGAGFDIVAMESAWRQLDMKIPWTYWSVRDTRTLFEVAGVSLKDKKYKTKTTHKAVEDAEHQAIVVQDAYKKLIASGLVNV